jgi:hypothetical protein
MESGAKSGRSIGPCRLEDEGWVLSGPAAQRLFDKSGIGIPLPGNELLMQPCEVLFCARHRHLELESDWLEGQLSDSAELLHETAALEAMRVPGEQVVLANVVGKVSPKTIVSDGSWALRWSRSSNLKTGIAASEVVWVRDFEPIQWDSLYRWAAEVTAQGRIAEILIVDEEMGVTTYRVNPAEPAGALTDINLEEILATESSLIGGRWDGAFMSRDIELPEQLGTPLPEGKWLDEDEVRILEDAADENGSISLLRDILARKLLPRPGFKYGTRWRLYEHSVGEEHAPWLLQPEWLAPHDWAQACLAARLANGVHKTWLCGFQIDEKWCYLALQRPPAEGRWSGFRH